MLCSNALSSLNGDLYSNKTRKHAYKMKQGHVPKDTSILMFK